MYFFQKPSVSEANYSASINYDLVLPVWQGIDDGACVAPFIWLVAKLILDLHSVANVEGLEVSCILDRAEVAFGVCGFSRVKYFLPFGPDWSVPREVVFQWEPI